jgi:hypothetical protein
VSAAFDAAVRTRLGVVGRSAFIQNVAGHCRSQSTGRRLAALGLVLLLVLLSTVLVRSFSTSIKPGDRENYVVNKWLDAQLAGTSGAEFAASKSVGVRFYAMTHWRILDDLDHGEFVVEIGSETPTGETVTGQCRVIVGNAYDEATGRSSLKVVDVQLESTEEAG